MRRFVLILLFVVLVISLNQDETWALPRLSDQILTEADLEEIIDRGLALPQILVAAPACNCESPTDEVTTLRTLFEADECDCASEQQVGWICGTPPSPSPKHPDLQNVPSSSLLPRCSRSGRPRFYDHM